MFPAPVCCTRLVRRVVGRRAYPESRGASGWQRVRVLLLLIGWTLATGAHWDVLQVAAWGRMWASNAQVQPLGLALATTFSPEAMCSVCKTVQAAKFSQDENPLLDSRTVGKAPLLLPALRAVLVERPAFLSALVIREILSVGWCRAAPPVPPPRLDIAAV